MFDFKFENQNEVYPLTAEQDYMINNCVPLKYYDREKTRYYLSNHNFITGDIFTSCLTSQGVKTVKLTFLKNFKGISRDEFIKRMYIYFFDLNHSDCNYSTTELFDSYKEYKEDKENIENEEDIDYEPLYKMLDKIMYVYRIPLNRIFDYLYEQFGNLLNFSYFHKWICYIELLKDINENNVFPFNLLYSYNELLIQNNMEPIIYPPNSFNVRYDDGKKMIISGVFPQDNNGNICFDWVGVWTEKTGEIKKIQRKSTNDEYSHEEQILRKFGIHIKISFYIELNSDSRVFFLSEKSSESEVKWKEVYSGPKVKKFCSKELVKARESLHLSQKEVAENCNINLRSYQRIESGESIPDALNLLKLIDVLDIDSIKKFVKKEVIVDPDYMKFKSGLEPSYYIENK